MHHSTIKAILMLTSTAVLPSQTAISVDGPLGKTTLFTSTVIKSGLTAMHAAHHSTIKAIWMLTKAIMLMTAVAGIAKSVKWILPPKQIWTNMLPIWDIQMEVVILTEIMM
jgi:hypothetical protein